VMKATLIDHMGSDLSVVNAARVSFGKTSTEFTEKDAGLIQFLARGCTSGDWEKLVEEITDKGVSQAYDDYALHPVTEEECDDLDRELRELLNHVKNMPTHWTPFGHTAITLHIKAPIFVARQLGKHQVGMVWNEVSRRYVTDEPEFFYPDIWRNKAENVKQGSADTANKYWNHGKGTGYLDRLYEQMDDLYDLYQKMMDDGVCPEQARMVLPQSMYTEWYWTGNLYSFANVYIQRTDSHAQREVQEVARQIGEIIKPLFPVSWEALTDGC